MAIGTSKASAIVMSMIDLHNQDCLDYLKQRDSQSIQLFVTSPPYYNARGYSQWESLDEYFEDMRAIFKEVYRTLDNHRYLVLNVGDIVGQVGKQRWSAKKIPLSAYFIVLLEKIGFQFVDDYIWDKGEPQSMRHLGNPPYPLYQYPVNSYEHIIVMVKHELDKTKIPCPICHEINVASDGQVKIGVQSWECKNPDCVRSKSNRGKRFSNRSIIMDELKQPANEIPQVMIDKWRKDIVKLAPVYKINRNKENTIGHTAPFPLDIPLMAIRYFSGVNEIVCDPFMGSGTSGIASKMLNRLFIGIELDKVYFELSKERIKQA